MFNIGMESVKPIVAKFLENKESSQIKNEAENCLNPWVEIRKIIKYFF